MSIDVVSRSERILPEAEGCFPLDGASTRILLSCADDDEGDRRPQLTSSPFRDETAPVPGSNERSWFEAIGNHWVGGYLTSTDYDAQIYSNWRTGKTEICQLLCRISFDLNSPKARAEAPYPKVMSRVKFPTTRAKNRKYCFDYLIETSRIAVINYDRLYVWKASMDRPKAIGPRASGCLAYGGGDGVELGSRKITWVVGKRLFIVNSRTLTQKSRMLEAEGASAIPTSQGVVVSVPNGDGTSEVGFAR